MISNIKSILQNEINILRLQSKFSIKLHKTTYPAFLLVCVSRRHEKKLWIIFQIGRKWGIWSWEFGEKRIYREFLLISSPFMSDDFKWTLLVDSFPLTLALDRYYIHIGFICMHWTKIYGQKSSSSVIPVSIQIRFTE